MTMLTWCRLKILQKSINTSCRFYMQHEEKVQITMPVRFTKKILKVKTKNLIEKEKQAMSRRKKGSLILSCKKPQYNFYMGQRFDKMNPSLLASHGWQGRKCAGDHFTVMPHRKNPALSKDESLTFDGFDLSSELKQRLQELELKNPTNIQRMAIPRLLKGENLICAAETGSGKTYAYLIPLINNILKANEAYGGETPMLKAPRCIINVPTRELVTQIGSVCAQLTSGLPLTTRAVCGGNNSSDSVSMVKSPTDVLVTTPKVLKSMLSTKFLKSSRLISLVLDEADSLMDDSFNRDFQQILFKLQATPSLDPKTGIQMALVSATLPCNLEQCLGGLVSLNEFQKVKTDHLHHLMSHVKQTFIKIKTCYKLQETVKIIKMQQRSSEPILIFCNTNDTCYYLSKSLEEIGIENVIFTSKVMDDKRDESFQRFQEGKCDVMVCSDVGSRGLNTVRARHVLNYDFPHFISDYIHRAGRVGRVGSEEDCQVTSFVTHRWNVELLWNIEMSARASRELHNVNANIKRKLTSRHESLV